MKVLTEISMQSWPAYEHYSGNLGISDVDGYLVYALWTKPCVSR